jgi:hypothetical protein
MSGALNTIGPNNFFGPSGSRGRLWFQNAMKEKGMVNTFRKVLRVSFRVLV